MTEAMQGAAKELMLTSATVTSGRLPLVPVSSSYSLGTCHPQRLPVVMMVREKRERLRGGKIMADPGNALICHLGKPFSKVYERQTLEVWSSGALERK